MTNVTYIDLDLNRYKIKFLKDLEIIENINEHSYLKITALLEDEDEYKSIYNTNAGSQVCIFNNILNYKILFQGMIKNIKVENLQENYNLTLEAVSNTYLLDIKKSFRSFQKSDMKYIDVINEILKPYQEAEVLYNIEEDIAKTKEIETFVMQYNETDWEFIKRLASHFNAGLIPSTLFNSPKFVFGIPKGNNIGVLENYNFYINKNIETYMRSSKNVNDKIQELDSIEFHIETNCNFNIGDTASFNNVALYIKSKRVKIDKGILIYHYSLCSKNGLTKDKLYNDKIIGLSLKGKVLASERDTVKVKLEIDSEDLVQKVEESYPFPYTTMYTAEGNSGWYCMPEVDDTVFIYFPAKEESSGIGVNSIRELRKASDKITNPDIKYFRTKNGKELKFSPNEILITCCNGTDEETGEKHVTYIRLNSENGIEIISTEPILLKSDSNMNLEAGENLLIAARKNIFFKCKTSQITVNDMVDIAGKEVRIN